MHEATEFIERLEASASRIANGDGPSDVFRLLLEGFSECSPRAAMLLVRQGALRGWSSIGYDAEAAARLRSATREPGDGWPERVAAPDAPERSFREPLDASALRLEDRTRREALASALRVGGRTLAVVVCERDPSEHPWSPAGMGLLLTVARLRLEFDLARRRLERKDPAVASGPAEPGVAAVEPETPAPAAAPVDDSSALEPATERPAPPTAEEEAARRFARLVATDIRLYNEEDVLAGRRDGDLDRRLREPLERGRDTFTRRYPSLGEAGEKILHEAYVQVLAGGDPDLLPRPAAAGSDGGRPR